MAAAEGFYPPYSHLMRDDEWTALAVWAMVNKVKIYGNTSKRQGSPGDVDSPDITFTADVTATDRALTGSGKSSLWSGGSIRVTHTGTAAGVHDLVGNVWEWTLNLGAAMSTANFTLYDERNEGTTDLGFTVPANTYVSALSTDPGWRRFGLPGGMGGTSEQFGGDWLWKDPLLFGKAARGGSWYQEGAAGIWTIALDRPRTNTDSNRGFRPALVFKD